MEGGGFIPVRVLGAVRAQVADKIIIGKLAAPKELRIRFPNPPDAVET